MEWKKITCMEYGKIVFHSIPYHALSFTNRSGAVGRSESSDSLTHLDQPYRQERVAHAVDRCQANSGAVEVGTEQKLGIIGISPRRIGAVEGHSVVSVISKLFQNLQHDIVCLNNQGQKKPNGQTSGTSSGLPFWGIW